MLVGGVRDHGGIPRQARLHPVALSEEPSDHRSHAATPDQVARGHAATVHAGGGVAVRVHWSVIASSVYKKREARCEKKKSEKNLKM